MKFNKVLFLALLLLLVFAVSSANASTQLEDNLDLNSNNGTLLTFSEAEVISNQQYSDDGSVSYYDMGSEDNLISSHKQSSDYDSASYLRNDFKSGLSSPLSEGRSIYVDPVNGADSNDGYSSGSPVSTLNKAISLANNHDSIYLASGRYFGLENTRMNLSKSISFIGSDDVTIDGENSNYLFIIQDGLDVSFMNIGFINGYKSPESYSITYADSVYGAALDIGNATVSLDSCRFIGNVLNYGTSNKYVYGGAISSFGDLTIMGSYFENNTARSSTGVYSYGGSIYNGGRLLLNDTVINGSYASDFGNGAGIANDGYAVIDFSAIVNSNSTQECRGSAVYNRGNMSLYNSRIEGNRIKRADFNYVYGAVYNGGNLTAVGNLFMNNSADYSDPIPSYKGSPNIYNTGNLNLSFNAFIGNLGHDGISSDLYVYGGDEVSLDNNWWNSNNNPFDDSKVNVDMIDSWLIFNLAPDYSKLDIGGEGEITAYFSKSDGGAFDKADLLPRFNVLFNADSISSGFNLTREIVDGRVSFIFNRSENRGLWNVSAFILPFDCSLAMNEGNALLFFNRSAIVDVGKIHTGISVELPSNLTYLDDLNISVEVTANDLSIPKGNLTVYFGDREYSLDLSDGKANITISYLTPGDSLINITYNGNDDYFKAFFNKTVRVEKIPVNLSLSIPAVMIDQKASAVASISTEGAYGQGKLYIDGTLKKIVYLYNGNTTIQLNNFAEGDYNITVEFLETQYYKPCNASAILKVRKYATDMNLSIDDIHYGETGKLRIDVSPESLVGEAELIVFSAEESDNGSYSQKVYINGATTIISLESFPAGRYNVTVLFKGDSKYYPSGASASFNVVKTDSALDVTVDYNESSLKGSVLVKTIPQNCTGTVGVYVNFNEYRQNLSDGQSRFDVDFDKGTNYIFVYYEGDDYYYGSTWNTTIGVADEFIIIGKNVTAYEHNDFYYSIRLLESSGVPLPQREVTIGFNGKSEKVFTDENGFADYRLNLDSGTYSISASYRNSTISNSIKVNEIKFNLTSSDIIYGDFEDLKVSFDYPISGRVNFIIDGVLDEAVDIVNSTAVYRISTLNAGSYTVKAIYRNDIFNSSSFQSGFTVKKADVPYELSVNEITPDDYPIFILANLKNASGRIDFTFNGTVYAREILNGSSLLNLSRKLPNGNYTMTFKYSGDRNYNGFEDSALFYVKFSYTPLVLSINDAAYYEDLIASARVNSNATGFIDFIVSDEGVNLLSNRAEIKDGLAQWNFTGLGVGKYNLTAIYLGDNYYLSSFNSSSFAIEKANLTISLFTNGAYLNENIRIIAALSPNATGCLTFSMLGYYSPRDKAIVDSYSMWYISPLKKGNYTVIAKYAGDENYYPANTSYILSLRQYKSLLTVEIKNSSLDDDVIAKVSLASSEGINGTVRLNIRSDAISKSYDINVREGQANFSLGNLAEGNYSFEAVYDGDEDYSSSSSNGTFELSDEFKVELSAKDLEKYYGEDRKLIVSVISKKSLAGEKVNVVIDNSTYSALINGTGKAVLDMNISAGNYTASISLDESSRYHSAPVWINLTVHPTVEAFDLIKEYGSSAKYYAIFCDSNGNLLTNAKVQIEVVNKTYNKTTKSDGIASLNINLKPGTYAIAVSNPVTGERKVTKIVVFKYLDENKDINQYYTFKPVYKVRAYGSDGKPASGVTVSIKVCSKTYKKTTDKDGYAKLNINLKPGTYTIKSSYKGFTVSNKITIKHILSGSNVNAKKSAQKITLKANIIKINGNLANRKIILRFNKKTLYAKTNKKGIATFTINKVIYKNLKVGKSYAYTLSYGTDTIKKIIKLK